MCSTLRPGDCLHEVYLLAYQAHFMFTAIFAFGLLCFVRQRGNILNGSTQVQLLPYMVCVDTVARGCGYEYDA